MQEQSARRSCRSSIAARALLQPLHLCFETTAREPGSSSYFESLQAPLLTNRRMHDSHDALQAVSREVPSSDQLAALYASLDNQQHARWQQQYMAQQQPSGGAPAQAAHRHSFDGHGYASRSYEDPSAQQVCFVALP